MVSVPLRLSVPLLAVTLTLTTPVPPLLPPVITIHPLSETAVHEQFAAVVTVTELAPPGASKDSVDGDTVYEHGVGVGSLGDFEPHAMTAAASTTSRTNEHRLDRGNIGGLMSLDTRL